jgi:threonine synthase
MSLSLVSTRDPNGEQVDLKQAILSSQPADGGLFTFPEFPEITLSDREQLEEADYQTLAKFILGKFDFGMTSDELGDLIDSAYGSQWNNEQITPLKHLDGQAYLLELHHGPTQAFKDVALQFLPRVLSQYRTKGEIMRALGASSGDTISAAHFGVGDVDGLRSIFLLPAEGPSEVQRLQSTANGFANAITILIEGSFDEGQAVIKRILSSPEHAEFKEVNNFISFNSINIARILAQIVYYFSAYLQLVKQGVIKQDEEINFSVPSGNFGDALAGVYAREMGLPIAKINVATNANDVLHRFLETGEYRPAKKSVITRAPSQDITKASNFERMIFLVVRDPNRVSSLMKDLEESGSFTVTEEELAQMRKILVSSSTSDEQIDAMIGAVARKTSILIDPHTATGFRGSLDAFPLIQTSQTHELLTIGHIPKAIYKAPTVCLATASHVKFKQPEGVQRDENEYQRVVVPLKEKTERFLKCEADEASIIDAIKQAVVLIEESLRS